jgi:hypothetical protein
MRHERKRHRRKVRQAFDDYDFDAIGGGCADAPKAEKRK